MSQRPLQSLADYLGTNSPDPSGETDFAEITDPQAFAEAILNSREFRTYIVDALKDGCLPAAITTRLMDYAWGQPIKRVEVKSSASDISSMSKAELLAQIAALEALAADLPDDGSIH